MYGHGDVYGYGTRVRVEGDGRVPRARGCRAGTSRRAAVPTPWLPALCSLIRRGGSRRRRCGAQASSVRTAPHHNSQPTPHIHSVPSTCAGMERTRTASAASASECALDSGGEVTHTSPTRPAHAGLATRRPERIRHSTQIVRTGCGGVREAGRGWGGGEEGGDGNEGGIVW
ncbi:hypothetical protein C8F04DRAFT_1188846 [Mycena alexandri]|uniref:Uncharacterized protein n=1 Tax=Mycena alexandri TaxID=1745969 RepID=A0AAD6WYK0_9AGAR|nr:hypothetical protein C8F04DRAFT_1188846 [Mycena alexandri]